MATIYTKTALKKIKKDELVQMFLDQQGKLNDINMDLEGDGWFLKLKENEKELAKSLAQQTLKVCQQEQDWQMLNDAIEAQTEHTDKVEAENEKLKAEIDVFRKSPAYAAVIWERDCLKEENQKLKEEVEGFRSVCNEYLQDESSTWEELRNWCDDNSCCDDLRDTIADMEDQLEEKEVDKDNMIDFIERSGGWGDYQEFVLEHCQ
jgi:DNA repair exonuclease SbcCD ATPase subunit